MHEDLIEEAYEKLKSAKFEEVGGCVLREEAWTAESLEEWMNKLGGNRNLVERVINHFHVYRLFWESKDVLDQKAVLAVGREIKGAWESSLKQGFPNKEFLVTFDDTVPDDGWLGGLSVTCEVARNV